MNNNSPDLQVLRTSQIIGPVLGIFSSRDGRSWTRVSDGPVQDTLENAIAKLSLEHSIHAPNDWMKVVDMKTGKVLHNEFPVVPHEGVKEYFPPVTDEDRFVKRNEWLARVLEWCLPENLKHHAQNQQKARALKRWFARHKIEVQVHTSGAMRITRRGEPIAEWLA